MATSETWMSILRLSVPFKRTVDRLKCKPVKALNRETSQGCAAQRPLPAIPGRHRLNFLPRQRGKNQVRKTGLTGQCLRLSQGQLHHPVLGRNTLAEFIQDRPPGTL